MVYELPLEDLDSKYKELIALLEREYEKAYKLGDTRAFEMLRDNYVTVDHSRRYVHNYVKIRDHEKNQP